MYKVEIPIGATHESFEQAAIARRRRLDEERKKRIFDPKIRIMGADVPALDQQIHIANEVKRIESEREAAFAKTMKETTELLQTLDASAAAERRNAHMKTNEFRRLYQNPWQRRDFDLYDPDALKKDHPARTDAVASSVSSLQRFLGEDDSGEKRRLEQKRQMRVWALMGIKEREERRRMEAEERRQYDSFQDHVAQRGRALQTAFDQTKAEIARSDVQFNQKMAEWRREKEMTDKEYEEALNQAEIDANVNGRMLTESPDVFNIGGGHKVRVDLFKGMTPAQKREILEAQEQQRIEAERKRAAQREEEYQWAMLSQQQTNLSMALQDAKEQQRREHAVDIRKTNEDKALEDRQRKDWIDRVLYTNPPRDEYFAQFNTTSR